MAGTALLLLARRFACGDGVCPGGKQDGQEYIGPGGGAVWEARTGKRVARFATSSWFGSVAFHPDGRHVAINDLEGIQLVNVLADKVVAKFEMPERLRAGTTPGSYASCVVFAPDGSRMATGHPDGSILIWDVKLPREQSAPLENHEAENLWADLAQAGAADAWRAVWRLADFPDASVPIIRRHVKAVRPAPAAVTRPLLADLDSDIFERREMALAGLEKLGRLAERALREHLAGNVSPEAKRRIEKLLQQITEAPQPATPEALQQVRAVAVLARIDSAEARQLLRDLANGVSLAPVTRAARAALNR